MRSIAVALLLSVAVASAWAAAPTASGPWFDPANADQYVFVGKDVWDAATGKLIAAGAAPILYQVSLPVVGRSDRLWLRPSELGLPGMPAEGMLYSTTDLYQTTHPTLEGKPHPALAEFPGFWIASDLRRAVWIDKGDFWRGMVDWNKSTVVDRKQVTHVGVFTGKSPLLWCDELLYVNGGFDPAKPVVRVDLRSGATEELETYHVFNVSQSTYTAATIAGMVSPSACNLVNATAETVYTYDARTGKAGAIHNVLFNNTAVSSIPDLVDGNHPPVWLDDDAVVFVNAQAVVTKLDLRKQEMKVLLSGAASAPERFRVNNPLPGGRYLDIRGSNPPADSMSPEIFKERFLIDLMSGQKIPTTLLQDADNGMWLDDSKFAYVRKTGGLSGVGTWLYDRHTNTSIRIAPAQLETTRMTLLRGGKEIWAVNTAGGTTLIRAKVDGSGSEELGPSQMFAPAQFPSGPALDLGLSSAPASPPPVAPTPAAAPVSAAPAPPKPTAPAAATQPPAATPPPAPPTPYAVCWGRQGPVHTVYFGAPFEVHAMNVAGWSAAYKQFLTDKYQFAGVIQCATSPSLAVSQQRAQQTMDTLRVHWTVVATGWKFE
jgi:hypothetical protein